MYEFVKHAHSGLRWVVLILLVVAIINAFIKRSGGSLYPGKDKFALFAMISVHIQLLLGLLLYLWLSSDKVVTFSENTMSNATIRFYTVEHLVGMLLGIALVTIGYSKAKRQAQINKGWKTIGVFYLLGLVVILVSIPWPFREELGGAWF